SSPHSCSPSWRPSAESLYPPGYGVLGIPAAEGSLRKDRVDASDVAGGKLDVNRRDVLDQPALMPCAGNRHDVVALGQHPRQRELRDCDALLGSDGAESRHPGHVLLVGLALKPRIEGTAHVGFFVAGARLH